MAGLSTRSRPAGWVASPAVHPADTVTLFEGATFCTAAPSGDIELGGTQGLFVLEGRLLSQFVLLVAGAPPEPLATLVDDPHHATFVSCRGDRLVVERHRDVADGLRDEIVIRNVLDEAAYVEVELLVDADFASPRAVRQGAVRSPEVAATVDGDDVVLTQKRGRLGVRVHVDASGRGPSDRKSVV